MKIKLLFVIVLMATLNSCHKRPTIVRRTETKLFGDSLKIDYTIIGDTIYQKRTDLKGNKDNGFDNSFDVKSVWKTIESAELDCVQKIKISKKQLDYIFCLDDVLNLTKKQIDNRTEIKWNKESIRNSYNELKLIKKADLDTISSTNYYMIYHFLRNTKFVIYDQKTKSNVLNVRVEKYETNFSGGHIYYLINKKTDTIAKYNLNDWIK